MRYLPGLAIGGGHLRLPLTAGTARRLVAALLAQSEMVAAERLELALALDPPLALWTLSCAASSGHDRLQTTSELAAWLAGGTLLDLLEQERPTIPVEPTEVELWRRRTSQAVEVAMRAREIARSSTADSEQAYLLGLLWSARQWLAAAGLVAGETPCLPEWLSGAWLAANSLSAEPPRSPAACAAAALHAVELENRGAQATRQEDHGEDGDRVLDELHELVARLARLRRLEGEFARTLETAKLAALKELAYGASHEINNPLANIAARAQGLLEDEGHPQRRRTLASIHAQAMRAHEMIGDMMLFARPPKPKPVRVDLAMLAARVVAELAPWADDQGTQLVLHAPAATTVMADPTQLAVALRALCVNALETLVNQGRVEISVALARDPAEKSARGRQCAQITVSDTGPGISETVREHLFDPFFSGREAGRGLGFGLSKCWRIVTLHGGRVEVDSTLGQGARFTVSLPLAEVE